jgi:hypothetical protein
MCKFVVFYFNMLWCRAKGKAPLPRAGQALGVSGICGSQISRQSLHEILMVLIYVGG